MPAKDLGTKYTCFKCGAKFYDLKKPEPLCPKCGADQRESPALKPAPSRRHREKEPVAPVVPAEAEEAASEEEADAVEEPEDDDTDLDEDEDEDL
jgi:uncharacterized protein (TIGR02300 family)